MRETEKRGEEWSSDEDRERYGGVVRERGKKCLAKLRAMSMLCVYTLSALTPSKYGRRHKQFYFTCSVYEK